MPLERVAAHPTVFDDPNRAAHYNHSRGEESIDCFVEWDDARVEITVLYHWSQTARTRSTLNYDSRTGRWSIDKSHPHPRWDELSEDGKLLSLFTDRSALEDLDDELAFGAMGQWAQLIQQP